MTIVALLLAAAVSPTPAPVPSPVPCASGAAASLSQEFLSLINAARRRRSLASLQLSEPLCRAARKRAEAIGRGAASLDALGGEDLLALVSREGYEARYAGELLVQARGTPREIAAGWNRDLAPDEGFGEPVARELGVGVASLEGVPFYVFLFAQGAAEEFRERTGTITSHDAVLAKMLEAVNAQRRSLLSNSGRPPAALELRRNALLDRAAQAHADDMLARSFYGHESPEGRDAWYRARAAGYRAWRIGENVAQGQSSLEEVMKGWMDSPDHRKNILSLEYSEAGFGLAVGKNSQGYQVLWVQVFGKPR